MKQSTLPNINHIHFTFVGRGRIGSLNRRRVVAMDHQISKGKTHQLIDGFTDDVEPDVLYTAYVRQAVESGLRDSDAGRVASVEDVRKEYGLPS